MITFEKFPKIEVMTKIKSDFCYYFKVMRKITTGFTTGFITGLTIRFTAGF